MASFFGEVATEVGGTVKDLATQRRDERLADEEHQRELRLQQMRMQHDRELTEQRIDADDRRSQRQIDARRADAEFEARSRAEEAGKEREHEMSVEELRSRTDIIQEAMRRYFSQSRTRTMSGNGYTMKNDPQQTIDPLTGGITYVDNWSGTAPNGQPLSVVGDKVFMGGGAQQVYPFESIEQQRQAESALIEGRVDPQRFYDDFGYWPSGYIFGQVASDDASFQQWAERNRIPLDLFGVGDRRGGGGPKGGTESEILRERMRDDYEYGPSAPMTPSLEEISEGPARDAHIAAQGGRTNAQIAQEMREAEGGMLAQGQAAAGELEQGGQLSAPVARGQSRTSPKNPYGFELDDAGAEEVASAINVNASQEAAALGMAGKLPGTL